MTRSPFGLDAPEDGYWLNWRRRSARLARQRSHERARGGEIPRVATTRIRATQGVTEVLVYANDRPGLFASLASAISASGAIATRASTPSGRCAAVDVFSIQTGDH